MTLYPLQEEFLTLIKYLVHYGKVDTVPQRRDFYDNSKITKYIPDLPAQVNIEGASQEFCHALIRALLNYGTIDELGRPAFILVLRYLNEIATGQPEVIAFLTPLLDFYDQPTDIEAHESDPTRNKTDKNQFSRLHARKSSFYPTIFIVTFVFFIIFTIYILSFSPLIEFATDDNNSKITSVIFLLFIGYLIYWISKSRKHITLPQKLSQIANKKQTKFFLFLLVLIVITSSIFRIYRFHNPIGWNAIIEYPDDASVLVVNEELAVVVYDDEIRWKQEKISLNDYINPNEKNYVTFLSLNGQTHSRCYWYLRYYHQTLWTSPLIENEEPRHNCNSSKEYMGVVLSIIEIPATILPGQKLDSSSERIDGIWEKESPDSTPVVPIAQRLPGEWLFDVNAKDTAVILVNGKVIEGRLYTSAPHYDPIDLSPYLHAELQNQISVLIWSKSFFEYEWNLQLTHDGENVPLGGSAYGSDWGRVGFARKLSFIIEGNGNVSEIH